MRAQPRDLCQVLLLLKGMTSSFFLRMKQWCWPSSQQLQLKDSRIGSDVYGDAQVFGFVGLLQCLAMKSVCVADDFTHVCYAYHLTFVWI